jgi:hypothetical protein
MMLNLLRSCTTPILAIAILGLTSSCGFIASLTGGGGDGETTVTEVPASPDAAAQAPANVENSFAEAVRKATSAAEATQNATTPEQWQAVAADWEAAINLMQAVPQDNPNYQTAQQKVTEYQKNLEYARRNAGG